jgi:hypothetical protein
LFSGGKFIDFSVKEIKNKKQKKKIEGIMKNS